MSARVAVALIIEFSNQNKLTFFMTTVGACVGNAGNFFRNIV